MSRLDAIKRVGFPPEECPACHGDGCEHCDEGTFCLRVRQNWNPPTLEPGQFLLAFLDVDHWQFVGVADENGPICECDFPFENNYAMGNHFETLGFRVEQS